MVIYRKRPKAAIQETQHYTGSSYKALCFVNFFGDRITFTRLSCDRAHDEEISLSVRYAFSGRHQMEPMPKAY